MKDLFNDLEVNSSKLGSTEINKNENLVKLLNAIGDLPFNKDFDDLSTQYGEIFEFLMV